MHTEYNVTISHDSRRSRIPDQIKRHCADRFRREAFCSRDPYFFAQATNVAWTDVTIDRVFYDIPVFDVYEIQYVMISFAEINGFWWELYTNSSVDPLDNHIAAIERGDAACLVYYASRYYPATAEQIRQLTGWYRSTNEQFGIFIPWNLLAQAFDAACAFDTVTVSAVIERLRTVLARYGRAP